MSAQRPPDSLWILTATGQDKPGITSGLLDLIARAPHITLVDLGQAVTHRALSLSFVLSGALSSPLRKKITAFGKAKGLETRILKFPRLSRAAPATDTPLLFAVTLIAPQLDASNLSAVTRLLAREGANIEAIRRLSGGDLSCLELSVRLTPRKDPHQLRLSLLQLSRSCGIDIGFQQEGLYRRAKRLVVFDMDSTLVQNEVIDELAREKGVYPEVAQLTEAAMSGKWDYDESLKRRVEKLKGLTASQLESVNARIQLTAGARELISVLKKLGYKVAVISGGFRFFADRLKDRLDLDYAFANQLEMENGRVSGKVTAPIVNARRKADLLETLAQQEGISLDQVIAIGDGANDLLMLERAGLGIAFNAKPVVRQKAKLAINQKDLRTVLYLLGLSESDVRQALA